jgi:hypothetical protein
MDLGKYITVNHAYYLLATYYAGMDTLRVTPGVEEELASLPANIQRKKMVQFLPSVCFLMLHETFLY